VREYWPTAALTATVVLGISAAASLLLVIGTKFGVSYTPPFTPQCCGFGVFIPDPEFYPSRISDPTTAGGGIYCLTFSCSHKFQKIENNFFYNTLKKIDPTDFYNKIVTKLSEKWIEDPDPGSATLPPGGPQ
jgi:hypothetical protein